MPFRDQSGNSVMPVSAEFTVVNENDKVIVKDSVEIVGGSAVITIPGETNGLPPGVSSGARVVTLYMHLENEELTSQVFYYLKRENVLEVGQNSIVSFPKALAHIPTMTGIHWNGNRQQLEAALMEAYERICSLPIQARHFPKHSLHLMNAEDWASVNPRLLSAFEKAQLTEAFDLLTDDPNKAMRDQRIFSRSVGESTTTFFSEKAIDHGISRKAWRWISRYMDNTVTLIR